MIGFTQRPTKKLRAASMFISCVLGFTGLFGAVNFAHAAALTSTSVTPASLVAGASSTVTVSFTTTTTIPVDGKIKVTFPAGFNVASAVPASCSTMDGGFNAIGISGQVVTITRNGAGSPETAAAETCTIGAVVNPQVSGATGTFTIQTTDASNVELDVNAAVATVTITAGVLTSTNVQPSNLIVATTNTDTVSFTTVNPIPSDGKIIVTFGSGFSLTSVVSSDATCSTMDGTFTAAVVGQVVTITRATGTSEPVGAQTCTIGHVRNPTSPGTTGTYTITTANSSTTTIDTLASVTADTIIEESTSSSSSTPVVLTYDITVSAPVVGAAFTAGEAVTVTWSTSESTGTVGAVNLDYSTNGGIDYTSIATATANDGDYEWTAPDVTASSVIIRAQATDLVSVLATDVSDAFSITGTSTVDESEDTSDDTTTEEPVDDTSDETEMGPTGDLPPGSFFVGESAATVYYVDSIGERRPFLNSSTFFTYANDFDDVEMISDEELAEYPLGSAMLPNPGVVLVKVQSLNNVYALEDIDGVTTLRWLASEEVAIDMYGSAWADYVVDIDVTLWPHVTIGENIDEATDLEVDMNDMIKRTALAAM